MDHRGLMRAHEEALETIRTLKKEAKEQSDRVIELEGAIRARPSPFDVVGEKDIPFYLPPAAQVRVWGYGLGLRLGFISRIGSAAPGLGLGLGIGSRT